MRLVIVGRDEPEAVATALARGCKKAGIEAIHLPAPPPLVRFRRLKHLRRAHLDWAWLLPHVAKLARVTRKNRPDAIVVVKALGFRPRLVRHFRDALQAPVWNFYPDIPYDPADAAFSVVASLAAFDGVFSWSPHLVERLRSDGIPRVELLRFACDDETYFPPAEPVQRDVDVSFIGTWHPDREDVIRAIGPIGKGLVAGPKWTKVTRLPEGWEALPGRIDPATARAVYWRSKVALNPLHPLSVPGYNMRTFEVPACGAVMLATRTTEHEELFVDGQEAVLYEHGKDAAASVASLLADSERRRRIAAAAIARASRETYEARARQLVACLG